MIASTRDLAALVAAALMLGSAIAVPGRPGRPWVLLSGRVDSEAGVLLPREGGARLGLPGGAWLRLAPGARVRIEVGPEVRLVAGRIEVRSGSRDVLVRCLRGAPGVLAGRALFDAFGPPQPVLIRAASLAGELRVGHLGLSPGAAARVGADGAWLPMPWPRVTADPRPWPADSRGDVADPGGLAGAILLIAGPWRIPALALGLECGGPSVATRLADDLDPVEGITLREHLRGMAFGGGPEAGAALAALARAGEPEVLAVLAEPAGSIPARDLERVAFRMGDAGRDARAWRRGEPAAPAGLLVGPPDASDHTWLAGRLGDPVASAALFEAWSRAGVSRFELELGLAEGRWRPRVFERVLLRTPAIRAAHPPDDAGLAALRAREARRQADLGRRERLLLAELAAGRVGELPPAALGACPTWALLDMLALRHREGGPEEARPCEAALALLLGTGPSAEERAGFGARIAWERFLPGARSSWIPPGADLIPLLLRPRD